MTVLARHGVAYVLVGGTAATIHGADRPTQDVDCLVERSVDNVRRLAAALRELNARLRVAGLDDSEAAALPVVVDETTLARVEISTWRTDAGNLDILADIRDRDGRRLGYHEVASRAETGTISGMGVRVASLDDLIASKQWANRAKDREALPELHELRRAKIVVENEGHEADPGPGRPLSARDTDLDGPDLGAGW